MKEFDKWWEMEAQNIIGVGRATEEDVAKEAWAAGVKWAAMRGMHHYGNDFLTDMNELSTEMQIELGMLDEHGKVFRDENGRILPHGNS